MLEAGAIGGVVAASSAWTLMRKTSISCPRAAQDV